MGRDLSVGKAQTVWMFPGSGLAGNLAQHMFHNWRNSPLGGFVTCGSLPFAFVVTNVPLATERMTYHVVVLGKHWLQLSSKVF